MSQALYRKWRPRSWQEVYGQEHVTRTLQNTVAGGRIGHAYLFSGPRGTGKTTVARLLAKAANCLADDLASRPCNQCPHCLAVNQGSFLDLIEIDAASNNSVEDVRDLRDKINFTPNQGRYKVYLVDEVHMLSGSAFNALLKTLEEPPPHAIFILATTEIHKIPATVLSRCQRHEFKRASLDDIVSQLKNVATAENIPADDDALVLIARQATGSFRDAISLLDQLASTGERVTVEMTHAILGTAAGQQVLHLVDAILVQDTAAGLKHLHASLDVGTDPRQLARQLVEYLRTLLLIRLGNVDQAGLPKETLKQAKTHAGAFFTQQLISIINDFNAVAVETRASWQPALGLELALAGSMHNPPAQDQQTVDAPVIKKIEQPESSPRSVSSASKTLYQKAPEHSQPAPAGDTQVKETPPSGKETSPAASPSPASAGLDQVRQEWKRITTAIKKVSNPLEAALNSCRSMEIKENMLVLGFASDVVMNKANSPESLELIQATIRELLNLELPVRCVVNSSRSGATASIKQGGMVATGLNLGGKITDIQD